VATSYFRERARNPHLRQQVAPAFEGDPNVTPTFSQPMPMASEVIERPPLRAEAPPVASASVPGAFSTLDPITAGAEAYQADAPTTFGGKFKDVLKSAALGFLQSAARDRENPLAAGVGGAVTGGAIQAVSPTTGRAFQFDMLERPRIEDQMRREQAKQDKARAVALDDQKRRETEADINLKGAQAKKLLTPEVPRAESPQMKLGRSRKTGRTGYYNALNPAENEEFEPIAESPYASLSGGGVFRRDTGEVTTPAPEKKAPDRAFEALNEIAQLKTEAEATWQEWRQPTFSEGEEDTPQMREVRRAQAAGAQERYNQAVANFGAIYGDWFETGQGAGGWAFVKPRQRGQGRAASSPARSSQPSAYKRNVNELPTLR
jgi:hypothetical protein